jgi:carboxymethylenebutenolidase
MARQYTRRFMPVSDCPLGALAVPESGVSSTPRPGVLLLPDVWGLSALYRELARRLSEEGFVTLALEPYGGPVQITDPGRFLRERSDPETLARIRSGVGFLATQPAVAGERVGVIGFCIGGTNALLAACALPGLSACVSFYGILSYDHGLLHDPAGRDPSRKPRDPLAAIDDLACPLLGFFGGEDEFVPVADVRALEARAARAGKRAEIRIYPGAGHAFANETRPQAFRADAARDAWARMLAFLRSELSGAGRG